MKTGTNGLNLIKQFEGCRLTAYDIGDGMITIGWGHAESKGSTNLVAGVTTWSQAQADNQLIADLVVYENAVNNYFTRSFNQNQFDALVSFAYNLGVAVFSNYSWSKTASDTWITSEMMQYVNKGTQFEEGLTRRRQAEVTLYNSGSIAPNPAPELEEEDMIRFNVVEGKDKGTAGYIFNGRFVVGGNTGDDNAIYQKLKAMENAGKIKSVHEDISSGEYGVLCAKFPSFKNSK